MVRLSASLAAVAAVCQLTAAQTFSDCDPTKKSGCAPRPGLNQAEYSIDFKATKGQGADSVWKNTAKAVTFGDNGAEFGLKAIGDSVTYATDFYIFFGYVEVKMRAAPGAGIVSSFVLQSDNLDEIDWEMIGSETDKVQSNYFGKGNTTTYDRGAYHNVQTPADAFHTYALDWTKESITWSIDGTAVRTVKYGDALGGLNYPQTPMNIRLGNWIAGTPGNSPGTIRWAGGEADMSKAPFNMYIESVKVKNYNPAAAYEYGDNSGSYQSIKFAANANSKAANSSAPAAAAASVPAASPNAGQVRAASSAPAVPLQPKASGQAQPKPPRNGGNGVDGHFDDDDECEDMEPAGPAKPAGTITVTPPPKAGDSKPSGAAIAPAPPPPSQAVAVVVTGNAAVPSSSLSSTLVASIIVASTVPAAAPVVAPSASSVVSFPLSSNSASATTYKPQTVTTNDASGSMVQILLASTFAFFSAIIVMVL